MIIINILSVDFIKYVKNNDFLKLSKKRIVLQSALMAPMQSPYMATTVDNRLKSKFITQNMVSNTCQWKKKNKYV